MLSKENTELLCRVGAGTVMGDMMRQYWLPCVYHGWKFDASGACIDMPNEPAESDFKTKVKAVSYSGADAGGITWIYMGQRQADPPGLPAWEWTGVPENQLQHS